MSTTKPLSLLLIGLVLAAPASAQEKDSMLLYDAEGLKVRSHLQFGLNVVGERNAFWDLADTFALEARFNRVKGLIPRPLGRARS
jgi:hypothetical protein